MKYGSWPSAMTPFTPICFQWISSEPSGVRLPSTALRSRRSSTLARLLTLTHHAIQPPPLSDRALAACPNGVASAAGCSRASTTSR